MLLLYHSRLWALTVGANMLVKYAKEEERVGKCFFCFNPNFVSNHLTSVYYGLFITPFQCYWHIFFFFDWLKYVILKCFHEIKYIRNVRFKKKKKMELAMWMQLHCMMCVYISVISRVLYIFFISIYIREHLTPQQSQVTLCKPFVLITGCIFLLLGLPITNRIPKGASVKILLIFETLLFKEYPTDVMYTCHIVMYLY